MKFDRTSFEEGIDKMLWDHVCPEELTFKRTIHTMVTTFCDETLIPGWSPILPFLNVMILTFA